MKRPHITSAFLVIVLATASLVAAQAPTELIAIYNVEVRPGQAAQFEEFLTKVKAGADKVGAKQYWGAGQVSFGGPGNSYIIGLPFDKWSDMDAWTFVPKLLSEAYGEEEGAKIMAAGNSAIQSSQTTISRHQKDLSYNAESVAPRAMVQIRTSRIYRDKQDQYRIFLQALNEAWEAAGDDRQIIRRTNVLGDNPVYTSARWIDAWSDLEDGGGLWETIEKAHGATAARRLRVVLEESVAESTVFVAIMRPDLSRLAPASSTSQ